MWSQAGKWWKRERGDWAEFVRLPIFASKYPWLLVQGCRADPVGSISIAVIYLTTLSYGESDHLDSVVKPRRDLTGAYSFCRRHVHRLHQGREGVGRRVHRADAGTVRGDWPDRDVGDAPSGEEHRSRTCGSMEHLVSEIILGGILGGILELSWLVVLGTRGRHTQRGRLDGFVLNTFVRLIGSRSDASPPSWCHFSTGRDGMESTAMRGTRWCCLGVSPCRGLVCGHLISAR